MRKKHLGLSDGVRLVRRWKRFSHIRDVHPARWTAGTVLWFPFAIVLLAMVGLAWIGKRLSGLDYAAEYWRDRFADRFAETEREHELRARAWLNEQNKPGLKGI